jgi:hypothetical protein
MWSRRLTSPGMAMGTPEYMAPEQAAGKPADERCDVYAVGAILYEALTGVAPYEGDNFMEVLTKKAMAEPTPVREIRPEVPEAVAELVLRAMARRPEDRPASMEVFEYEVTKCLAGRGEAVANILGMRTDHELVVSLNPGLALPPAPPEVERRKGDRHPSATDAVLLEDESTPVAAATPSAEGSGENDTFTTDAGQTTVLTPMRVRRLGILGWMAGAAALLVAAGVILYVASGDPNTSPAVADDSTETGTDPLPQPGRDTRTAAVGTSVTGAATTAGTEPGTATDQGTAGQAGQPGQQTGQQPGQQIEQPGQTGQTGQVAVQTPAQPGENPGQTAGQNPGQAQTDPGAQRTPPPPAELGMSKEEADKLLKQADAKRLSDPDGAIKLYQQVVKGGQQKRRAYLGMAEVAFNRKDWDGAINYARKAGGSTQADRILGHSFLRKGDKAQARRHYEAVIEREPNDQTIRKLLDSLK